MSKNFLNLDYFVNSDKCLSGLGIRSALPHCTTTSKKKYFAPHFVCAARMGDQTRYWWL